MPTTTIIGKKGGGKTYYALLAYVRRELVYGDRCVVGTLALKLPDLSEYLARKYPHKNIDVTKRVRILTREEGRRFWLHRGPGVDLADVSDADYDNGRNPDYSSIAEKGGVLYVIDEIHIDFDARNWAKIGRGLTYYNSQERKLQDDQVFITQHLALVDRRVKDFSQEFVLCRNYRYEKFLTYFSKGSGMVARHYSFIPNENALIPQLPDEKHDYRINAELAACYDTTQGVGFKGTGSPDKQGKKKGWFPWWTMWVLIPVLWLLLSKGSDFIMARFSGKVDTSKKGESPVSVGGFAAMPPAFSQAKATPSGGESGYVNRPMAAAVYAKGIITRDRRVNVLLSDGRTLTEPDGMTASTHWQPQDVVDIRRNGVRTHDGTWYPLLTVEKPRAVVVKAAPSDKEEKRGKEVETGPAKEIPDYSEPRPTVSPSDRERINRAMSRGIDFSAPVSKD